MISLKKLKILAHTQILPKTVGDLGKLIVAKGFKKFPKVQKLPNLVTLVGSQAPFFSKFEYMVKLKPTGK